MPPRSLIVLTFDALATSPLAPYGCSWLDAPGLNRLAASSLVFDRIVAASVSPRDVLAGFLRKPASGLSVATAAASLGMPTSLFTDSHEAIELGIADAFDQCVRIDPFGSEAGAETEMPMAGHVEEMHVARLLAAALAHRESLGDTPGLLWIHSSSLAHYWDAPPALRTADESHEEEDDFEDIDADAAAQIEAARQAVVPPNFRLADDADPDLLLAWMAAYGGQIRAIDTLVDVLLDTLDEGPATDLVLASTSGFSLGEHGWIGAEAGPPQSPRIQLPLMIRRIGSEPLRSLHPASSNQLAATLIEMIRGEEGEGGDTSLLRDAAPTRWSTPPEPLEPICETAAGDQAEGIVLKTTPGWFYCRDADGDDHLYLKPDDRNDVNDIANLRPEVVQMFRGSATDS